MNEEREQDKNNQQQQNSHEFIIVTQSIQNVNISEQVNSSEDTKAQQDLLNIDWQGKEINENVQQIEQNSSVFSQLNGSNFILNQSAFSTGQSILKSQQFSNLYNDQSITEKSLEQSILATHIENLDKQSATSHQKQQNNNHYSSTDDSSQKHSQNYILKSIQYLSNLDEQYSTNYSNSSKNQQNNQHQSQLKLYQNSSLYQKQKLKKIKNNQNYKLYQSSSQSTNNQKQITSTPQKQGKNNLLNQEYSNTNQIKSNQSSSKKALSGSSLRLNENKIYLEKQKQQKQQKQKQIKQQQVKEKDLDQSENKSSSESQSDSKSEESQTEDNLNISFAKKPNSIYYAPQKKQKVSKKVRKKKQNKISSIHKNDVNQKIQQVSLKPEVLSKSQVEYNRLIRSLPQKQKQYKLIQTKPQPLPQFNQFSTILHISQSRYQSQTNRSLLQSNASDRDTILDSTQTSRSLLQSNESDRDTILDPTQESLTSQPLIQVCQKDSVNFPAKCRRKIKQHIKVSNDRVSYKIKQSKDYASIFFQNKKIRKKHDSIFANDIIKSTYQTQAALRVHATNTNYQANKCMSIIKSSSSSSSIDKQSQLGQLFRKIKQFQIELDQNQISDNDFQYKKQNFNPYETEARIKYFGQTFDQMSSIPSKAQSAQANVLQYLKDLTKSAKSNKTKFDMITTHRSKNLLRFKQDLFQLSFITFKSIQSFLNELFDNDLCFDSKWTYAQHLQINWPSCLGKLDFQLAQGNTYRTLEKQKLLTSIKSENLINLSMKVYVLKDFINQLQQRMDFYNKVPQPKMLVGIMDKIMSQIRKNNDKKFTLTYEDQQFLYGIMDQVFKQWEQTDKYKIKIILQDFTIRIVQWVFLFNYVVTSFQYTMSQTLNCETILNQIYVSQGHQQVDFSLLSPTEIKFKLFWKTFQNPEYLKKMFIHSFNEQDHLKIKIITKLEQFNFSILIQELFPIKNIETTVNLDVKFLIHYGQFINQIISEFSQAANSFLENSYNAVRFFLINFVIHFQILMEQRIIKQIRHRSGRTIHSLVMKNLKTSKTAQKWHRLKQKRMQSLIMSYGKIMKYINSSSNTPVKQLSANQRKIAQIKNQDKQLWILFQRLNKNIQNQQKTQLQQQPYYEEVQQFDNEYSLLNEQIQSKNQSNKKQFSSDIKNQNVFSLIKSKRAVQLRALKLHTKLSKLVYEEILNDKIFDRSCTKIWKRYFDTESLGYQTMFKKTYQELTKTSLRKKANINKVIQSFQKDICILIYEIIKLLSMFLTITFFSFCTQKTNQVNKQIRQMQGSLRKKQPTTDIQILNCLDMFYIYRGEHLRSQKLREKPGLKQVVDMLKRYFRYSFMLKKYIDQGKLIPKTQQNRNNHSIKQNKTAPAKLQNRGDQTTISELCLLTKHQQIMHQSLPNITKLNQVSHQLHITFSLFNTKDSNQIFNNLHHTFPSSSNQKKQLILSQKNQKLIKEFLESIEKYQIYKS